MNTKIKAPSAMEDHAEALRLTRRTRVRRGLTEAQVRAARRARVTAAFNRRTSRDNE